MSGKIVEEIVEELETKVINTLETKNEAHTGRVKINSVSIVSAIGVVAAVVAALSTAYGGITQHADARADQSVKSAALAQKHAAEAAQSAVEAAKTQQYILDTLNTHGKSIDNIQKEVHELYIDRFEK